jgi:hypothetical protein
VTNEAQLQWEARWARPAAAAAFCAAVLLLAQVVLFQSVLDDRPHVQALPDFLLSVDQHPGLFLGSAVVQALGVMLVAPVFLYLFQASMARGAGMPRWFVYLVYIGPILYGLATLLGSIERIDLSHQFAGGDFSGGDCPAIRGKAGDNCAEDLLRDKSNGLYFGLSFAGSIAVAFLYVMLPLRARRVGLLSPFMGILGVVAGALLVLQLVPLVPTVVQAFWLGAMGALYLGNWPGGRGPAWESGEAEPWPTPARRRGLFAPPGGGQPEPEPAAEVATESEPAPQRPSSRKRKRKKRR